FVAQFEETPRRLPRKSTQLRFITGMPSTSAKLDALAGFGRVPAFLVPELWTGKSSQNKARFYRCRTEADWGKGRRGVRGSYGEPSVQNIARNRRLETTTLALIF